MRPDLSPLIRLDNTLGLRHDITQGEGLMEAIANTALLADKGYNRNPFVGRLRSQSSAPVLPTRLNGTPRDSDKHPYNTGHNSQ